MNLTCKLLLFLFFFKVSVSYEVNRRVGKITGGYEARPHSNPYVVSLQYRFLWYRYRICSGSILSERWILSAGHCVTDSRARWRAMDAIVGAHNLARISGSQIYPISHRIAHPMYRGGVGPYDISMMRTAHKMEFSKTVQPINLPRRAPTFRKDEKLLITGWGALQANFFVVELPNKLREAEVTYLPYYECYRAVNNIKEKYDPNPLKRMANLCTGPIYGGIAGCTADSGGPLVQYVSFPNVVDFTLTTDKEESRAAMTSNIADITGTAPSMTEDTTIPEIIDITTTEPFTTESTITTPTTTAKTPTTTFKTTTTKTTTAKTTTTKTTTAKTTTFKTTTAKTTTTPTTTASTTTAASITPVTPTSRIATVVGVISWGVVPCGTRGAPTVYSNVTNYLDFINKYLYSD